MTLPELVDRCRLAAQAVDTDRSQHQAAQSRFAALTRAESDPAEAARLGVTFSEIPIAKAAAASAIHSTAATLEAARASLADAEAALPAAAVHRACAVWLEVARLQATGDLA